MYGCYFLLVYVGMIEDLVIGIVLGVMGVYYVEYLEKDFEYELDLIVE